jgi:hypothetical protein
MGKKQEGRMPLGKGCKGKNTGITVWRHRKTWAARRFIKLTEAKVKKTKE